jgi:hypothetical protein
MTAMPASTITYRPRDPRHRIHCGTSRSHEGPGAWIAVSSEGW